MYNTKCSKKVQTKLRIKIALKIIITKLIKFQVTCNKTSKKMLQKEQVFQESELLSSTRNKPEFWFLLDSADFFCLLWVVLVKRSLLSSRAFKSSSLITRSSLETTFWWSFISNNSRSSFTSITDVSWLPLNLPTMTRTQTTINLC